MNSYLRPTFYFNFEHKNVLKFVKSVVPENTPPREAAIRLYNAVRDTWKYNPYTFHFKKKAWQASQILQRDEGQCLDKSVLLITFLRAVGIPARLHLAKVKNHIGVEKIIEKFSTDVLTPHGYVEIFLSDTWVAATPAFNKTLCDKLKVEVLEFDGVHDSIFQQYGKSGDRFMEYLEDYGTFDDFPLDFVRENLKDHYEQLKPFIDGGKTWTVG